MVLDGRPAIRSDLVRLRRVLAVAQRDLHQVGAGRSKIRLPLIALGLLLPAGAIPLPRLGSQAPTAVELPVVRIEGSVSDAVRSAVRAPPIGVEAPVTVTGGIQPTVRARGIPPVLRDALDRAPGEPRVVTRTAQRAARPTLPKRSLLVVLLAVSLLTGPLAESLPGERARGTLEVLLSSAITRSELITGKWLAWTAAASAVGLVAALTGVLTGVQPVGWWVVGIPASVGAAVAFGLWLVRGVADVVSGATAPMRVVPLVALALAGVAWAATTIHPLVGAAVPLGGALLVAGGILEGPAAAAVGTLTGLGGAVALNAWTAFDLDRQGRQAVSARRATLGLAAFGTALWWLAVAGPGVWALAGNPFLQLSQPAAASAGGLLCLLAALVAGGRDGKHPTVATSPSAVFAGLVVGAMFAAATPLGTPLIGPAWTEVLHNRLAVSLAPGQLGMLALVLVAVGHELLFRGVLLRRAGPVGAVAAWVIVATPLDPLRGLFTGIVLTLLARRRGLSAAIAAHLAWGGLLALDVDLPWPFGVAALVLSVPLAAWPANQRRP